MRFPIWCYKLRNRYVLWLHRTMGKVGLQWRQRLARVSRWRQPWIKHCAHCGISDNWVRGQAVWYTDHSGCDVGVCIHCWNLLDTPQRIAYFEKTTLRIWQELSCKDAIMKASHIRQAIREERTQPDWSTEAKMLRRAPLEASK